MTESISLASGYGAFLTPAAAAEAAVRSMQAGPLPVLEAAGLPALREAIAQPSQAVPAAHIGPENVVVTPGAKAALFLLLQTVLRPGDEVLLPTPNWFGFGELITRAGGVARALPLSAADTYAFPPELLRTALTPRTRVLLLSNPNNPTGRVYHREELAALLAVTREYPELFVLSDEIYNLMTFAARPVPSLLEFPDPHGRHLVVNGFSKSLALIGWNIGYLVAPLAIARACAATQRATGGAVAAPIQDAALAVTQAAASVASGLVHQLQPTRRLMLELLAEIPHVPPVAPEATYYAFPDLRAYVRPELPAAEASAELVSRLQRGGLEVVDGATCGAPGFIRISYAVSEPVLREGLSRLAATLQSE